MPGVTLRACLSVLLAVTLVVTAQTLAAARAQPAPAGTMVICAAQGLVTVAVDAQGEPVGPPHICPDGALALMAGPAPVAAPLSRADVTRIARAFDTRARAPLQPFVPFAARAPPRLL